MTHAKKQKKSSDKTGGSHKGTPVKSKRTKKPRNRKPKAETRSAIMLQRGAGAPVVKFGGRVSRELSREAKEIALSTLLPLSAKPCRVRSDAFTTTNISSACTRHFRFHSLDCGKLLQVEGGHYPKSGHLPGGGDVWGNMMTQFSIVSILDSRLYAIVPSRVGKEYPRVGAVSYYANRFMNQESPSAGQLQFFTSSSITVATPCDIVKVNDDNVMWLEPVDFYPSLGSGYDPEIMYGEVHPVLDFEGGRYVWIDANDPENNLDIDDNFCTFAFFVFTLATGARIDTEMASLTDGSLSFCCQRLPNDADRNGDIRYGNFQQAVGPNDTRAHIQIQSSGYYRFGLKGYLTLDPPGFGTLLTNVNFGFKVCRQINVLTRHLINDNLTKGEYEKRMFATEQCVSGSMLIKNVSPKVNLGGQIYALSVATDEAWYRLTENPEKIKTSNTDPTLRYAGNLDTGAYGWLRNANLGFRTCHDVMNSNNDYHESCLRSYSISRKSNVAGERIRGMNVYNIIPPSTQEDGLVKIMGTTLQLQMAVQLEYTTENQTPLTSSDAYDFAVFRETYQVLSRTNTFSENPLHIEKFTNAARNAWDRISGFYSANRNSFRNLFDVLSTFGIPVLSGFGKLASVVDTTLGG